MSTNLDPSILCDSEINLQSFALDITKLIDIESDTEYCLHNFLLRSSSLNFTKFWRAEEYSTPTLGNQSK
jgi:hypothetical protein